MCPQTSQARHYPVPLRQEYSLVNTRQPACELLGSDGFADDNDDQPGSVNEPDGGKSNLDVRAASLEKSQILLHARQGHVLLQVHPQAHPAATHSHQLLTQR